MSCLPRHLGLKHAAGMTTGGLELGSNLHSAIMGPEDRPLEQAKWWFNYLHLVER